MIEDILLDIGAMSFSFHPPFTYSSGIKSPIYLDNRLLISYPAKRKIVVDYFLKLIESLDEKFDAISATATSAIPLGAWIADRLDLPLVYVRAKSKGHGAQKLLEGHLKPNSKVLVIEDHISTAQSALHNAEAIRAEKGIIRYCLAISTYESKISKEAFEKHHIQYHTLTTGKAVIQRALERGMITPEQKLKIEAWFKDPENWQN